MTRYRMVIAYDGHDFHGWQRQKDRVTVQGTLEAAVLRMSKRAEQIRVAGASRTDSGVHAEGQVAVFDDGDDRYEPRVWMRGLNGITPDTLAIRSVERVDDSFDPRRLSTGKRYVYRIWCSSYESPFTFRNACRVPGGLNVAAMQEAASALIGEHDFSAFRASDCQSKSTIRTLTRIDIESVPHPYEFLSPGEGTMLRIVVEGSAFLKNMVRIMAGTLIEVGQGRRRPKDVENIVASRDRTLAGRTARAHGLTLVRVFYPPEIDLALREFPQRSA